MARLGHFFHLHLFSPRNTLLEISVESTYKDVPGLCMLFCNLQTALNVEKCIHISNKNLGIGVQKWWISIFLFFLRKYNNNDIYWFFSMLKHISVDTTKMEIKTIFFLHKKTKQILCKKCYPSS